MLPQFHDLTERYEQHVVELAEQVRSFVLANCPGIQEEIDIPANLSAYNYGKGYKNVICTIILSKKGVKLGFYRGSELPDPGSLLEGTGKVHRYVSIKNLQQLKECSVELKNLLKEACIAFEKRN